MRVLMCAADHFGVEYVINPWMKGHVGRARNDVARGQWAALREAVGRIAEVERIEPQPGLPDMCFTANGGFVMEEVFVPSVFRVSQREPEVEHFNAWAKAAGYRVAAMPGDLPFEGEGDALHAPGEARVWAGYGVRSALESHRTLSELLNVEVVSLRLVDERFYHLDTCFVPLPGGRVMFYPRAFDEPSLREIERRVPGEKRLIVGEADAMRFACNALRVGERVVMNHASRELREALGAWGLEAMVTPVDEFLLAGGAVKCLSLLLEQEGAPGRIDEREAVSSPIADTVLSMRGHLLDAGLMNRTLDRVNEWGGSFHVEHFAAGERRDQESVARVRISAPTAERLDMIVNQLQPLGVEPAEAPSDARLATVEDDGVAPDEFYSTTIYPTDVRVGGRWVRAAGQRMDAVVVVDGSAAEPTAACRLMRDLRAGERVVCGVGGVRVQHPARRSSGDEAFAFMSAGVSSERRVELVVEELAWEMRRIRARGGKIAVVAGPVVVHTGGSTHLAQLVRDGYVQALLTGNALPVHDIELNLYGTSLGVDLARGEGVPHGHQHHLRAINKVRRAGSIRAAVEQGVVTGGVMYECVKRGVECVLAGSIRDDGPLPDTLMDLHEAQHACAKAIEGAEMILMLASMLHAIGVGNMTPAGVRLVCVDITPAVVTKLADRGSVESTGIVTDVGLFLNLLAHRLREG